MLCKYISFAFQGISEINYLMESDVVTRRRNPYLQEIKEYREENGHVFYLNETWFDTHERVHKGWNDGSRKCALNIPPS